MIPYYTISTRNGHSDLKSKVRTWNLKPILYISENQFETCLNHPVEWVLSCKEYRFNPFRDHQAGGTSFGFRGRNYWVLDATWLGWVLRIIFS